MFLSWLLMCRDDATQVFVVKQQDRIPTSKSHSEFPEEFTGRLCAVPTLPCRGLFSGP